MEGPTRHKSPIDHALDLLVYVPVGFVAEAPSLLPRFAQRGRDQLAMVRAVGRFAVRRDPDELHDVVEHHPAAATTLRALGLVPAADEAPGDDGDDDAADDAGTRPAARLVPVPTPTDDEDPAPSPVPASGIDPETLAIPDYESLSASQVIPRLESLTHDELESIRRYEAGNRARRTILNKVAQLQAG